MKVMSLPLFVEDTKEKQPKLVVQTQSPANSSMGGVDLTDQYMSYYLVGRKTMKWWRRVFWRMHDDVDGPRSTHVQRNLH